MAAGRDGFKEALTVPLAFLAVVVVLVASDELTKDEDDEWGLLSPVMFVHTGEWDLLSRCFFWLLSSDQFS